MKKTGERILFFLEDEQKTLNLGQRLAETLIGLDEYPALLFTGPLGAGKTTIIRGIVQELPGGEDAEVSSPSFNILNIYPTKPETAHFDLYRLEGRGLDPESEDILFDEDKFILVEWSEFLPKDLWPDNFIWVELGLHECGRLLEMFVSHKSIKDKLKKIQRSEFTFL